MKGDFRRRISTLETRFKDFRFLGRGSYGAVGRCGNVAIKIQDINDVAKNEIAMLKKLNLLSDETKIFTKASEFMVCADIPKKWVKVLPTEFVNECESPFLFIVMECNTCIFNPSLMTDKELRYHLKLLIEGFMIARKRFGIFSTGDFSEWNWMMTRDKNGQWIPKLIDFGFASTGKDILEDEGWFDPFLDDGKFYRPKNDFIRIEMILKRYKCNIKGLDLTKAKEAKADNWEVLQEILSQKYFK